MLRSSPSPQPSPPRGRGSLLLLLPLALLLSCAKPPDAEQQAPPPVTVTTAALEPKTVEDFADYLGQLTSRRAVILYPQVSGYVREIIAKPGTLVKAGTLLLRVDAQAEAAGLQNLIATRESLQSNAAFAKDRRERSQALRADGIVSQQDVDQARAQADQAEASLRASDALITSQKARLSFFTITAPIDGVVGDIPVKVGDFVTPATPLTSVTQDSGLEVDVQVPVERVASLGDGSRVRLVGDDGKTLAESAVTFTSPRADPVSQLVLLKGAFEPLSNLRAGQVVRTRVIFSSKPGLSIPATSVTRQAGQTFAFVVEKDLKAKRVPVTLGALIDNHYVVLAGLDAGQQLVVSGLQMVADGATVQLAKKD